MERETAEQQVDESERLRRRNTLSRPITEKLESRQEELPVRWQRRGSRARRVCVHDGGYVHAGRSGAVGIWLADVLKKLASAWPQRQFEDLSAAPG
jgi:hypothetical protein